MRVSAAVASSAFLLACAAPPAPASEEDVQLWLPVALTASFTDAIQGWYEIQPRIGDDISEATQLLLRTALGLRFAPACSAWLGYAWTPTFEPTFQNEYRIYEQFLYVAELSAAKVTSRTRFEQRWIEGVSGTALRLRTLLRAQVPFTAEKIWALVAQDEIFFHLNTPADEGPRAGFDQNRFFLGPNRTLTRYASIDAGYQLQVVDTRDGGFPDRLNHIVLIQLLLQH